MKTYIIANQPVDDPISQTETTIQFTHLIQEQAFLGKYPFVSIIEGLKKQFEDYINMDDTVNYVDVFFNQIQASYNAVNLNDAEEHPNEIKEVLDRIYREFIDNIQRLFIDRLAITVIDIDDDNIYDPDLEFIIRRLYEFFILGAKNNFKVVIAMDVASLIRDVGDDDDEYFRILNQSLDRYSPLLTTISIDQFIRYRGDQEVFDLFQNGRVTGNFLRKYSPKLYQNEDFQVELINYITMVHQFKQDMISK